MDGRTGGRDKDRKKNKIMKGPIPFHLLLSRYKEKTEDRKDTLCKNVHLERRTSPWSLHTTPLSAEGNRSSVSLDLVLLPDLGNSQWRILISLAIVISTRSVGAQRVFPGKAGTHFWTGEFRATCVCSFACGSSPERGTGS